MSRADYCPISNEPCQSLCHIPCRDRKPMTEAEVDEIILYGGHRNAAGGIYATRVYEFVRDIEAHHGVSVRRSESEGSSNG